jgi:hypothetical protein
MQKLLFFAFLGMMFLAGCKFNPNVQDKGADMVQGEWAEQPVAFQNDLLQYTQHDFRFSCDSFYVTLRTRAKTNIYPDSCFNKGSWTEYAKGTYRQGNDTLYLSGTFTKANWKQKITGCYRTGQYLDALIIKKREADTLHLRSLTQHVPLKLVLTKPLVCQPKPLN